MLIRSTPILRRKACLLELAVASTRAPTRWAYCTAAKPTPPAAEWINTVSPLLRPAILLRPTSTVQYMTGIVAASSIVSTAGLRWLNSTSHIALSLNNPTPIQHTWSPTWNDVTPGPTRTTIPAHSHPGKPGSPGYIPSMFKTSRKFRLAAWTSTSICSAFRALIEDISLSTRFSIDPLSLNWSSRGAALSGSVWYRFTYRLSPLYNTSNSPSQDNSSFATISGTDILERPSSSQRSCTDWTNLHPTFGYSNRAHRTAPNTDEAPKSSWSPSQSTTIMTRDDVSNTIPRRSIHLERSQLPTCTIPTVHPKSVSWMSLVHINSVIS